MQKSILKNLKKTGLMKNSYFILFVLGSNLAICSW